MKKALFSVVLLFALPLSTFAYSVPLPAGCNVPPDHAVWNDLNNAVVSCISASAWDAALAAQSHGTALPVFFYPQVVTDKYGISYDCAVWMPHGCVDATKTPEYDTYIRALGQDLVSQGYHPGDFGGRFDGVMSAVR